MEKIVSTGMKIDLHIHSILSKFKDGKKVTFNTIENLPTLIDKLNVNKVNICAITDHDSFDYGLYKELKKEELHSGSIRKVLPGVEFSVQFKGDSGEKVIHIITIFDDQDDEKIKQIESILKLSGSTPEYDSPNNAFTEEKYISLLREIDVDTVMIAHQKKSLTSQNKTKANDAASLGEKTFNEFLFTEYFEAFEFRNKKNEIFNKNFTAENDLQDELRFITGSDCHSWNVYPNEDDSSNTEFNFTYFKCLPTFKGIVMAITDHRRIKHVNSFFNPSAHFQEQLELQINERDYNVPLSRGINVIIGDNSIGKSLLLHEITNKTSILKSDVRKGYKKYLSENNIQINTHIHSNNQYCCDMQGDIRSKFETGNLKGSDFLKKYFPQEVDSSVYKSRVERELSRFYAAINNKFLFDENKKKLSKIMLPKEERVSQSLTFIGKVKQHEDKELQQLNIDFDAVLNSINNLLRSKRLIDEHKTMFNSMKDSISSTKKYYETKLKEIENNNCIINAYNSAILNYKKNYTKKITDEQKLITNFMEDKSNIILAISDLVCQKINTSEFSFNLEDCKIVPNIASIADFQFVSKLNVDEIGNSYLDNLVKSVLKKGKKINIMNITEDALKEMILYYPPDIKYPIEALKKKINEKVDDNFSPKNAIIENGMDKYTELSAGFNSQMYFTLLCAETTNKGVYIIDQPEDQISQKAIREKILDQFKSMGNTRQVICVTHNPQFIVNLDVDNVILLAKDENSYKIMSGALEYEDSEYNVLQLVADNIEGGLDTISRRLKRYEKGI